MDLLELVKVCQEVDVLQNVVDKDSNYEEDGAGEKLA